MPRSLEEKHNKKFRFTITTNGLLLDEDKRRGEAVFAAQVAVVRNVQAHRLYRRFYGHFCILAVFVGAEKYPVPIKLVNFFVTFLKLFARIFGKRFCNSFGELIFRSWRGIP